MPRRARRRPTLTTCVLAGAVALATPAAAVPADDARRACRTLEPFKETRAAYLVEKNEVLYGCSKETGRATRVKIGDRRFGSTWSKVALAGHMVAFEDRIPGPLSYVVYLVDLKRGRLCNPTSAGTGSTQDPADPDFRGGTGAPVHRLTVTRWGALAYVAGPAFGPLPHAVEPPDEPPWHGYEVIVQDHRGFRRLAVGEDIDPRSLRRSGSTVTWVQAGRRQTGRLDRTPVRCTTKTWFQ